MQSNLDRRAQEVASSAYELRFPNSQRAIDEAAKLGMDVVFPEENQLQLDIDSNEAFAQFEKLKDVVKHHWGIIRVDVHPSKSGGEKRHVTVTMEQTMDIKERILVQACLGSDRTRELLSYLQVLNGDEHPVLFLEPRAPQLLLTAGVERKE